MRIIQQQFANAAYYGASSSSAPPGRFSGSIQSCRLWRERALKFLAKALHSHPVGRKGNDSALVTVI
ncbi:hypothetical protein [Rhizobium sp. YJ-22]|uniref:hypothetical protein n=1 Tax=Rhizobium sp. YJ-22 TaxID=3037556 RepID=UPI002412998F|nr:hypothetical protein [Rhizobium sp. YJ-22]